MHRTALQYGLPELRKALEHGRYPASQDTESILPGPARCGCCAGSLDRGTMTDGITVLFEARRDLHILSDRVARIEGALSVPWRPNGGASNPVEPPVAPKEVP